LTRLCVASVADQGVDPEHIVQDAGSTDETASALRNDSRVRFFQEKDLGMYDALNRGFDRSTGDILGWLNCDEQYLPDALAAVVEWFQRRPDVDVLFGDVIMTDPEGNYLFHRRMQVPLLYHTWTCHLSTLSCATFFRRRVFFDRGFRFDQSYRASGDGEWMVRLLRAGIPMDVLGRFTATFCLTGQNLSESPTARRENLKLRTSAPFMARAAKPLVILHHRLRRWWGGMYARSSIKYEVYALGGHATRQARSVLRPRGWYGFTASSSGSSVTAA
jgi:glycosyltransferase involved in cell wall biosynthesis